MPGYMPTGLPQLWNPMSFYTGLGGLGGLQQNPFPTFSQYRRQGTATGNPMLNTAPAPVQPWTPAGAGMAPSIPIPSGQFLPGQLGGEYNVPSWTRMPATSAGDGTSPYTGPPQYFGGTDPNWIKSLKPKRALKAGEIFQAFA